MFLFKCKLNENIVDSDLQRVTLMGYKLSLTTAVLAHLVDPSPSDYEGLRSEFWLQ